MGDKTPKKEERERERERGSDEVIRTLFLSGLPPDVKDRELYILFRPFDGYESSQVQLTSRSPHPVGFAVFVDQDSALIARDALNGVVFDPSTPSVKLRVELAKSNSKPKRARDEGGNDRSEDKKYRSGASITVTGPIIEPYQTYTVSGSGGTPAMTHSYVNNLGGTAYQRQSLGGSSYSRGEVVVIPAGQMVSAGNSAKHGVIQAPMTNVYGTPLATSYQDQDVGDVYAGPTYQKISAHGGSVEYVDHQDVQYSAQVINQPAKFVIPASDRGALQSVQLEYPRTRMGVTRAGNALKLLPF
eukprot:TRINITY_DN12718_c1_g1_i2.p1 TRINITY_DN12718_c1_g1~~TRINITY_DN12718_c1_g1_i2.p1  ORF type:complete len:301 (-),score=35.12 TRINITY_DN12718_c1_g1_i2:413-1315(-)